MKIKEREPLSSGVLDKNKREICDGDVIVFDYQSDYQKSRSGVVKYDRGAFSLVRGIVADYDPSSMTKIGNIFENILEVE